MEGIAPTSVGVFLCLETGLRGAWGAVKGFRVVQCLEWTLRPGGAGNPVSVAHEKSGHEAAS
jgi:hypothetical protein